MWTFLSRCLSPAQPWRVLVHSVIECMVHMLLCLTAHFAILSVGPIVNEVTTQLVGIRIRFRATLFSIARITEKERTKLFSIYGREIEI